MATKAKVKKAKAKTSKATKSKPAKARAAKVVPSYLKPGESYEMSLDDVVRALLVIDAHGHLDAFVKAAKKAGKSVSVNATGVNLVKDFMVKHRMHDDPVGKHIVNARGPAGPAGRSMARLGNPYGCKF